MHLNTHRDVYSPSLSHVAGLEKLDVTRVLAQVVCCSLGYLGVVHLLAQHQRETNVTGVQPVTESDLYAIVKVTEVVLDCRQVKVIYKVSPGQRWRVKQLGSVSMYILRMN